MKNRSNKVVGFCLALFSMLALPAMAQQTTERLPDHPGRFAPPPSIVCDPSLLSSFNGVVTSYERGHDSLTIIVRAEWGALKTVTIGYVDTSEPAPYFRMQGQAFKQEDWARIEVEPGVLMEGMSAIVWTCEDAEISTIVDWLPL